MCLLKLVFIEGVGTLSTYGKLYELRGICYCHQVRVATLIHLIPKSKTKQVFKNSVMPSLFLYLNNIPVDEPGPDSLLCTDHCCPVPSTLHPLVSMGLVWGGRQNIDTETSIQLLCTGWVKLNENYNRVTSHAGFWGRIWPRFGMQSCIFFLREKDASCPQHVKEGVYSLHAAYLFCLEKKYTSVLQVRFWVAEKADY